MEKGKENINVNIVISENGKYYEENQTAGRELPGLGGHNLRLGGQRKRL